MQKYLFKHTRVRNLLYSHWNSCYIHPISLLDSALSQCITKIQQRLMNNKSKFCFGNYPILHFVQLLRISCTVRYLLTTVPFPPIPPMASPARSDCCRAVEVLNAAVRPSFLEQSLSPHSLFYSPFWAQVIVGQNLFSAGESKIRLLLHLSSFDFIK